MAEFQKLQTPLTDGEKYYYPVTTYDQIIMPDGISRWDGTTGSNEPSLTEDTVRTDRAGTEEPGLPTLNDADTLGGKDASQYIQNDDVRLIPTGGNRGQILSKKSNADSDLEWIDQPTLDMPTICGKAANESGDVNLTSFDVGAVSLGKNTGDEEYGVATGINADTFDGKDSSEYAAANRGLPSGGSLKQILAKQSDNDYDATWIDMPTILPEGGEQNQILSKSSSANFDLKWISLPDGVYIDLLWENASPLSTFAAQSIDLDAAEYSMFIVVSFNAIAPPNLLYANWMFKGYPGLSYFGDGQYKTIIHRSIQIYDTYASIDGCWNNGTQNANDYAVPYKIYGIRGESNEVRS